MEVLLVLLVVIALIFGFEMFCLGYLIGQDRQKNKDRRNKRSDSDAID